MRTVRLSLVTAVLFLVLTLGAVHLGCSPAPGTPPKVGPLPVEAQSPKENPPPEPAATLPPIGESAKPEPATAQKADYLEVVGVYPLPESSIERLAVLYLSEAVVCPQDKDGNEKPPIRVEPKEAKFSCKVRDNHIAVHLADEIKDAPFSFISITVDPGLKSASGKPINPATGPILLPTGREGTVAVNACTLADGKLSATLTGPIPAALLEKYYTRTVNDAKGTPLTAESKPEGPDSAKFAVDLAGPVAGLPATLIFTRTAESAGPLDAWLAPALKVSLPAGNPLTLKRVDWTKSTDETRDALKVTLSESVKTADFIKQLKVSRADNKNPVQFTVSKETTDSEWNSVLGVVLDSASVGDAKTLELEVSAPLIVKNAFLLEPLHQNVEPTTGAPEGASEEGQDDDKTLHATWQYWDQAGLEGLRYEMNFNAPVDVEVLKKALTVKPEVAELEVKSRGDSISLSGNWKTGQQYQISIADTLQSVDGKRNTQAGGFAIQTEPAPKVLAVGLNLPANRFYIARRDLGPMPMAARNITEASIRLSRLFPSNIARAVNDMDDGKTYGYFDEQYTEPLATRDLKFPDTPDTLNTVAMNVDKLMPADKRGVFTLHSMSKGREYDTKILLWTDIGLVSHFKDNELIVFAHNLYTLEPLAGAKVTVYSNKSQAVAAADTDASGTVHFTGLEARMGKPTVVVAETPSDATFLRLTAREEDGTPFKENMPAFEKDGYDGYIYLDRNLYRPGETVHARSRRDGKIGRAHV